MMFDKLAFNLATAIQRLPTAADERSANVSAYIRAKISGFVLDEHRGLAGNAGSRRKHGVALAKSYDRRWQLSDACYKRDTSHWAGR